MRSPRTLIAICLAGLAASAGLPCASASAQRSAGDSIQLAGRTLTCKHVRIMTDRRLPSEGAAAPGVLILNPTMMNAQPAIVRLFVFNHECGHHNVGESELKADCWAVQQGVREGWLDTKGLGAVCRSFDDAPETPTHPSGRRRCRNLDQCFTAALASLRTAKPVITAAIAGTPSTAAYTADAPPRLVKGPTLVSTGTLRYSDAAPCKDPTAKPVEGKSARAGACQ